MEKVWSWRQLIQSANLSATTKLVLLNLSIYMNDRGEGAFPSVPTQAKDTSLSERAVYSAIKIAIASGFLVKTKFYRNGNEHNAYQASAPVKSNDLHYGIIPPTIKADEITKDSARKYIANLLQTNKLIKSPCIVCGEIEAQAHHFDYEQKENIYWLCLEHHKTLHNLERRGAICSPLNTVHPSPECGSTSPLNTVHPNSPSNSPSVVDVNKAVQIYDSLLTIFGGRYVYQPQSISKWLEAGADYELDIRPIAEAYLKVKGEPPRSLSWLDDKIINSMKIRNNPLPKGNNYGTKQNNRPNYNAGKKSLSRTLAEQLASINAKFELEASHSTGESPS